MWLGIAIFCLCAAFLLLGFILGNYVLPRLGFSEGTVYKTWLSNRRFGDHVASLRRDEISYVQFDLEEYTITFQKIRMWHPTADPDLSNYIALEEEDAPESH